MGCFTGNVGYLLSGALRPAEAHRSDRSGVGGHGVIVPYAAPR